MTLSQLRTFLAVADAGSVHASAHQLYVTQSAVSASITALQRSLGIQLIRRDGWVLMLWLCQPWVAPPCQRYLAPLDDLEGRAAVVW